MHGIRRRIVALLSCLTAGLVAIRVLMALNDLLAGDVTAFIAFPLAVLLPALAFGFLATRHQMKSAEGALMQLGAMIQLSLIIAFPGFALYLALGFPVVFLVVELFETHLPARLRDPIKRSVLA